MPANAEGSDRLEKQLGLLDVYAICTGAMFASGFFLLPGIAAANAGPSVVLAYFVSSLLMVPAMYSIAELSSAMPRAAGTYFFIHRSMGPLAGTVGGLGAWAVLIAKSAFALVGMGAYLTIFIDVPIVPVAVALTVAFGVLNVLGAKETARLQVWLVAVLVAVMVFFIVHGIWGVVGDEVAIERFRPFAPFGFDGFVSTIGLVFISYAGLTKVSSAAEEIRDLDRNLPLGMILALVTVGTIYTAGVAILVGFTPAEELRDDLTPVATAGTEVFAWMPPAVALGLVVLAAVTAFASTGNAGILTASRYPLAMARDRLLWSGFDRLGRFGTPTLSVVTTCALMIAAIVFLDVERLASLGSAFLLLLFALINLSVILMRESRLESYAPGYRSPLYPWMQILGFVATFGLIFTLGVFYVGFVVGIILVSALWFRYYVRPRVARRGAIYGLFRRLGEVHDAGVDEELWGILQERGPSEIDSFDELVARAHVITIDNRAELSAVEEDVRRILSGVAPDNGLAERIRTGTQNGILPERAPAAVFDVRLPDLEHSELVLIRAPQGVRIRNAGRFPGAGSDTEQPEQRGLVTALLFLVTPEAAATQRLRVMAQLVSTVEASGFVRAWRRAESDQALLETLMRRERFASLVVGDTGPTARMVDRRLRELSFPGDTLVAMVWRGEHTIVPDGDTLLREGDRLTIIGSPEHVQSLLDPDGESPQPTN
ncbi:amino acid permease [Egicoccus halophilus]|uniref:Amino acid transporter n=1 Tax=Egicoccus halophilus TaxID=1670830 RepID=A0A8J3ESR6_9ACTN|nr:amino acid permease [Egicoccus halophilus]GGI07994.1 amino acid transporter [Egicoccus halophilus]